MYALIDSSMAARLDFYRQHLLQGREIGPAAWEQVRRVARGETASTAADTLDDVKDEATVESASFILSQYLTAAGKSQPTTRAE